MVPKGSKYHYSRSLLGVWAPKVYTILLLGPFGVLDFKVGFLWRHRALRRSTHMVLGKLSSGRGGIRNFWLESQAQNVQTHDHRLCCSSVSVVSI